MPILSTTDIPTPIDPNFDQEKHDFYLSVISSTKIDTITSKLYPSNIKAPFSLPAQAAFLSSSTTPTVYTLASEPFSPPTNHSYSVRISSHKGTTPSTLRTTYHQISESWTMDIPESLPYNYMMWFNFLPFPERAQIDSTLSSFDVLYMLEHEEVIYTFVRFTIKKILMIKPKECIYMSAFKKISPTTWIETYSSYEDFYWPRQQTHDRMSIVLGGVLYENDHGGPGTLCSKFTLLDPRTGIPVKVVKGIMGKYFKGFYRGQARVMAGGFGVRGQTG